MLGALLCLEVVLRLWLVSPSTTVPDPVFEYFQRPYSRQIYSGEGYTRGWTNRLGFYDEDPRVPSAPLRAVLLGDSYAEAKQVFQRENFGTVAENNLPGLEVCNAGRSGWAGPDFAAYAEQRLDLFHPDVIVVQYNTADLDQFHRAGEIRMERGGDGEWMLVYPREPASPGIGVRISRTLRWNSALLTQVHRRILLLTEMEQSRLLGKFTAPDAQAAAVAETLTPEEWVERLVALHRMMAKQGKPIVYVLIPYILYGSEHATVGDPERREAFRELSRLTAAPLVDPTDAFIAEYERTRQPVHGFQNSIMGRGHINRTGHRIVGELLAAELEKYLP